MSLKLVKRRRGCWVEGSGGREVISLSFFGLVGWCSRRLFFFCFMMLPFQHHLKECVLFEIPTICIESNFQDFFNCLLSQPQRCGSCLGGIGVGRGAEQKHRPMCTGYTTGRHLSLKARLHN